MSRHNVICELVVTTYDLGPGLSGFVAEVVKMIRATKTVNHILTPMGSIIEGEWDEVMKLLNRIFENFAEDYERLSIQLKIDYRRSKQNRMKGKVESVEEKLTD